MNFGRRAFVVAVSHYGLTTRQFCSCDRLLAGFDVPFTLCLSSGVRPPSLFTTFALLCPALHRHQVYVSKRKFTAPLGFCLGTSDRHIHLLGTLGSENFLAWLTKRYAVSGISEGQYLTRAQGASPRELILEACRRNNTSLLEETLSDLEGAAKKAGQKPAEYIAETLNKAADGVGNGCLHVAATYGSCECMTAVAIWANQVTHWTPIIPISS